MISYTIEPLLHLHCGDCGNSWTEKYYQPMRHDYEIICPHCGAKEIIRTAKKGIDSIDTPEVLLSSSGKSVELTLRDQFAMAAMQGLLASTAADYSGGVEPFATDAYKFADAMLAERVK